MMTSRYVVVADASRARLFHATPERGYELVVTFERGAGHAPVDDRAQRAGAAHGNARVRSLASMGSVERDRSGMRTAGRSGAASMADARTDEVNRFARELSTVIEATVTGHDDEGVVLVAPPRFLAILRGALSTPIANRVERAVGRDLTKVSDHDLPGLLGSEMSRD